MLYVDSLFPRPNDWDNLIIFFTFTLVIAASVFRDKWSIAFFGSNNIAFIVLYNNNSKKIIIMNGKLKKVHAFNFILAVFTFCKWHQWESV